jgi:hypothetical protein
MTPTALNSGDCKWNQVTAGVGFAILTQPWSSLPHAVGQWIPSLCEFLTSSEYTIEMVNTYTVCTRRVHDRILMEDAMTGDFTDSKMRMINRCRLFLQVECLLDVCTADGLTADPGLKAKSPHRARSSGLVKGSQGRARGQYDDDSSDHTHVIL